LPGGHSFRHQDFSTSLHFNCFYYTTQPSLLPVYGGNFIVLVERFSFYYLLYDLKTIGYTTYGTIIRSKSIRSKGGVTVDTKAIGARIKAAREAKNLTQESLAAIIDLSTTHMSVIERGIKAPKLETFVSIANALEVSADSLLLDVVDHSTSGVASKISVKLDKLPGKERKKILKALDALVE
jgi:transcriptional regulator with XRE-family HTH domain